MRIIQLTGGRHRSDLHIQQNEFKVPITINEQPDLMDIENFYQKDGNFW